MQAVALEVHHGEAVLRFGKPGSCCSPPRTIRRAALSLRGSSKQAHGLAVAFRQATAFMQHVRERAEEAANRQKPSAPGEGGRRADGAVRDGRAQSEAARAI